jgi:hypothetical protein
MFGMNFTQLLLPTPAISVSPLVATAEQPPAGAFDQMLQVLSESRPATESALPELMAVVASLAAPADILKEKKPPATPQNPEQIDPVAALPAEHPAVVRSPQAPVPNREVEIPTPSATPRTVLNLKDVDVRRFEFKAEAELQIKVHTLKVKPVKGSVAAIDSSRAAPAVLENQHELPPVNAPEGVHGVQVAIDAPPPPPDARQNPAEIDPLAAVQTLLGLAPQIAAEPAAAPPAEGPAVGSSSETPAPSLEVEIPKPAATPRTVLNLRDFDVRRFEFKTEVEMPALQPKLIRIVPLPVFLHTAIKVHTLESKLVKGSADVVNSPSRADSVPECQDELPLVEVPESETPNLEVEIPTPATPRAVLNLKDFDARRFEFKTELETPALQPKLLRVAPLPVFLHSALKVHTLEGKPAKGSADVIDSPSTGPSVLEDQHELRLIEAPEAVHRVQVAVDPPPPPPIVRQISIDIGDSECQVRVVIRERNGDLAVQFGAATERLRENLQNASPLLLHELQRDNAHNTISLDFSRFGTATEGGHESHQQSRQKKALKPEAVFADVDETAYLTEDTVSIKPF